MTDLIQTQGLSKSYADFNAVIDVSLHVESNEIYGFLGPNGAGKTTTIMMLLGLEQPTTGKAQVLGTPAHVRDFASRRRLGALAERQVFYDDMTAREYLRFFGRLYQVPQLEKRIDASLDRVNLLPAANARARDLSRGMQQKLGFVRALLHDPDLLILDEPVSALDPRGVVEIREVLLEEVRRGKTVFISSHVLTEVEQLANRIGIMNKGHLVAEDSLANIRRRLQPDACIRIELTDTASPYLDLLRAQEYVSKATADDTRLAIHVDSNELQQTKAAISRLLFAHDGIIVDMQTDEMSLEEAFVTITDRSVTLMLDT